MSPTVSKNETVQELLPCPFCGNEDTLTTLWDREYIYSSQWTVYCSMCGTNGPRCGTEEKAIGKWNRRVKRD